jgi:hypothetical protein
MSVLYFDGSEATREHMVKERELRDAFHKIVMHAHAPQGDVKRMTRQELMQNINILEKAWRDVGWTVYYP